MFRVIAEISAQGSEFTNGTVKSFFIPVKKKEEMLKKLANKMADNVVRFKKVIKLEPMSAYERMIIHTELATRNDVTTESVGVEPRRRVVIKLKR